MILYIGFFFINIYILWKDILYRKISNISILILVLFLPFWYYFFPAPNLEEAIIQYLFAICIIVGWIFFYKKNGFLWSGDIKYWAILILFLWQNSLSVMISNIWIVTLCTLLFWYAFILWQIIAIRKYISKSEWRYLIPQITFKKTLIDSSSIIFDWIIIWYFVSILIKFIYEYLFEITSMGWDYYFIVSVITYLFRPLLRFGIVDWKYRIFPILIVTIIFWKSIQEFWIESFLINLLNFIKNIWQYALIFIVVTNVTRKTFTFYDGITHNLGIKKGMNTIPYSIIIFIWFSILFFFHTNLVQIAKNLL